MPSGNVYHMAIRGDANIAGMYAETPDDFPDGAARVWSNDVCVADAEATVKRIEANGGKVVSGPSNAGGWGIRATVATPENAVFGYGKV